MTKLNSRWIKIGQPTSTPTHIYTYIGEASTHSGNIFLLLHNEDSDPPHLIVTPETLATYYEPPATSAPTLTPISTTPLKQYINARSVYNEKPHPKTPKASYLMQGDKIISPLFNTYSRFLAWIEENAWELRYTGTDPTIDNYQKLVTPTP